MLEKLIFLILTNAGISQLNVGFNLMKNQQIFG